MKKTLLFLSAFTCAVSQANAQNCTELFISEYVEGSGNDKALELYNPTGVAINLTGYRVERFSNGSSTSSTGGVLNLSGSIAAYSTFVIANGQTTGTTSSPACSPVLQGMANQLDGSYPAPTYMNGNDAIVLFNSSTIVDILGKTGDGTIGSSNGWGDEFPYDGSIGAVWTENHTLVRKSSVLHGVTVNPDPFIVSTEWDSLASNTWSGLGSHSCDCFVGIPELSSNISFVVFPNPTTNGIFNVSASEIITEIKITDLLGQEVFFEKSNELLKSKNINVSDIDTGMYQITIKYTNNILQQSNIIIQ